MVDECVIMYCTDMFYKFIVYKHNRRRLSFFVFGVTYFKLCSKLSFSRVCWLQLTITVSRAPSCIVRFEFIALHTALARGAKEQSFCVTELTNCTTVGAVFGHPWDR